MGNIFDKLKEVQAQAPVLNLTSVNKTTLPQITQNLTNMVKTQDQLQQQQQKLTQIHPQQSGAPQQQPGQLGRLPSTTISEEGDYPGSVDGKGDSKAFEPKTLPTKSTATMGSGGEDFKAMGMTNMASDGIPILEDEPEDEQPAQRFEIEDHINDLLTSMFGFKYYFGKEYEQSRAPKSVIQKKDIQGSLLPIQQNQPKPVPFLDQLNGSDREFLMSDREFSRIIRLLDFDKFSEALNALIRYKQKINEENFVKSETFRIIAENELPRISKGELIDYIKNRKI